MIFAQNVPGLTYSPIDWKDIRFLTMLFLFSNSIFRPCARTPKGEKENSDKNEFYTHVFILGSRNSIWCIQSKFSLHIRVFPTRWHSSTNSSQKHVRIRIEKEIALECIHQMLKNKIVKLDLYKVVSVEHGDFELTTSGVKFQFLSTNFDSKFVCIGHESLCVWYIHNYFILYIPNKTKNFNH